MRRTQRKKKKKKQQKQKIDKQQEQEQHQQQSNLFSDKQRKLLHLKHINSKIVRLQRQIDSLVKESNQIVNEIFKM